MKNNGSIIEGTIVGRRSMGRKCAFADVSISGDDNEAPPIKLIFRHQSFLCPSLNNSITVNGISLDEPFPNKDASLPYGAKVIIQLGICQKVTSKIDGRIDDVYEVLRWKVIEHPRELAEQLASLEDVSEQSYEVGHGAMSCSTYFQARGEAFDSVKQHRIHSIDKKKNRSSSIDYQTSEIPNNTTTDIDYSDVNHGGKEAKAKRAKVFASWVLDTFFDIPTMRSFTDPSLATNSDDTMSKTMICQPCSISDESTNDNKKKSCLHHNTNVYDIAGGKGQLSVELMVQQMYHLGLNSDNEENDSSPIRQCTIIDPLVRKGDTKHRQSKLKKAQSHVNWLQQNRHDSSLASSNQTTDANTKSPDIKHLAMEFNATSFEQHIQPTSSPKLLLGLHPDQCTEDILDVALEHNLSVAIVPCCGKYILCTTTYHFWRVEQCIY